MKIELRQADASATANGQFSPNTGKKITSDTSSHRRLNVWVRRFELPAS